MMTLNSGELTKRAESEWPTVKDADLHVSQMLKEFAEKSNYNRHLARKTPCAPILDRGLA